MTIFETLIESQKKRGAGFWVLIDPDKWRPAQLADIAASACEAGADAILVGGSLLLSSHFDRLVGIIKKNSNVPVILFPGDPAQLSDHADAILFLSLISGRNPAYLIGDQVKVAPVIKSLKIEPISVGYMLIESGVVTSAEFMSDTKPIPRRKADIAKATALSAEYFGMKLIYLEAGSGAKEAVPETMITEVHEYVSTPIIVGGGIRTPEQAEKKVRAGASFVVIGNVFENDNNCSVMRAFASAIHTGGGS